MTEKETWRLLAIIRRGLRSSALPDLVVAQAAIALGALLINLFVARALGPSGRGEVAFLLQVSYVVGNIAILGRDRAYPAVANVASGYRLAARDVLSLIPLPLFFGALLIICAAIAVPTSDATFIVALGLLSLLAGNVTARALRAASIAARKGRPYLVATALSQLLMTAAAIFLLTVSGATPGAWLLAYGMTQLAPSVCVLLVSARPRLMDARGRAAEQARIFGLRLAPLNVIEAAMARADRLVLPLLADYHALGLYATVATCTELVTIPFQQLADSSVPRWSRADRAGSLKPGRILLLTAGLLVLTGSAVGWLLLHAVVPLFGAAYTPALSLVPLLTAAACLRGWTAVMTALATASRRSLLANSIPVAGLAGAIPLYLTLIPRLGAQGAALGLLSGAAMAALLGVLGLGRRSATASPEMS